MYIEVLLYFLFSAVVVEEGEVCFHPLSLSLSAGLLTLNTPKV